MKRILRQVYSIETFNTRVNDTFNVNVTYVTCGFVESSTKTTDRVSEVLVKAYINGNIKLDGHGHRRTGKTTGEWPNERFKAKPISVSKDRAKGLIKIGESIDLDDLKKEAFSTAIGEYMLSLGELDGEVRWFRDTDGWIQVPSLGTSFLIHACNIKGAKTWYPETACMYLKEGEKVKIELWGHSGRHSSCGIQAKVTQGGHFDKEAWDKLDQDNLAFKCNEKGEAVTGLFAQPKKGGLK